MKHKEIITVFCALLHIQLLSGSSLSDQVHQTPPDMFTQQGQTAQIQCSHRIQSYNQILWYKQTDGQMKLLGYMFMDNPTLEPEVNVKIEGNANKDQNCTLTTEAVSSSAVYYCAASSSLSDQVHQSPPDMFSDPGNSIKINCSHSIDSYNQFFWYKQSEGRLQLLGYVYYKDAYPEPGLTVTMGGSASKDETCTLTVEKLTNMDVISWKHTLLTLSVFVLGMAGLVDGSDVNQPELLWKEKGNEATISCNHTKGFDYTLMYWYRQLPGETMKLIVFTTTVSKDHDFGDFSKDKFSATKPDAQSGTFTVKNLLPEDNGVYFCAVSQHSDEDDSGSCTKTHLEKRQQCL
ncbi:uncharacterized protein V6R79_018044 [Siganus canaliculatus]